MRLRLIGSALCVKPVSTRKVPAFGFVTTSPCASASFMALYTVPSLTSSRSASLRTDILLPGSSAFIYESISSFFIDMCSLRVCPECVYYICCTLFLQLLFTARAKNYNSFKHIPKYTAYRHDSVA